MRRFQGFQEVSPELFRAPVAFSLGVFDGVHRGHQALLGALVDWAKADQGDSVVLTFGVHPREVLTGHKPPPITALEQRLRLFESLGIDHCLILPFDERWASTAAIDFLKLVHQHVRPAKILLGANHKYGKGREGDFQFTQRHADSFGYSARLFELESDDQPISSTRIREAVQAGDLPLAESMLGRPVSFLGQVIQGDQRGRTLGFPTANIDPSEGLCPASGVYAGSVELSEEHYLCLINVGCRPTFKGGQRRLIEVHILGFDGDLYGQSVELCFLSKLREEQRFTGIDELTIQIAADRAAALEKYGSEPRFQRTLRKTLEK